MTAAQTSSNPSPASAGDTPFTVGQMKKVQKWTKEVTRTERRRVGLGYIQVLVSLAHSLLPDTERVGLDELFEKLDAALEEKYRAATRQSNIARMNAVCAKDLDA